MCELGVNGNKEFYPKIGENLWAAIIYGPVLGELVGGILVGVSCLHLLVFSAAGADASSSVIISFLETKIDS